MTAKPRINRITVPEAEHLLGRSRCFIEHAIRTGQLRGGTENRVGEKKFKVWWVDYEDAIRLAKELPPMKRRQKQSNDGKRDER